MLSRNAEQQPPSGSEPRIDGLPPAALQQLQAAARAIRDGAEAPARKALDATLELAPEHPEALRLYAILHTRAQRQDEAQACLQQVLAQWPDYALAWSDLGGVQQARGDMEAAFASWRQACALAPAAPMPWFNLGRNLQLHGDTDAAIEALQQAHALAADFLPALILLGDALVHAGRFDEADARYRAALALHPACGDAWRGLANMKTRPLSDADREQLGAALRQPGIASADRIAMGFALGKVCEDQGRYEEAFHALNRANAELREIRPWQPSAFHGHAEALLAASRRLPPPIDAGLGREVIFIVGLPRSGSTLFEQILAAHPEVEGASELTELEQVLGEESARRRKPLLQWLGEAGADDWQRLGRRYLELTTRWRRHKPRHTDKLPSNWLLAGVLGTMLPGAPIIDARRDALEAGWSCYKQQFYKLPHFACTLTDIAAYVRDYERIMGAWQAAEPQRIRIQRYEALLATPEDEIRALLAFCDLPFDPGCLDYHLASRNVRTASAAQVRQPLRHDTARAEHYGALLDPLRFGLGLPKAG
ncbi:sulfotransferase [Rhodanobacter sp. Root561]|uniref:tetratricopeptide repeat-containing sulfotransferase family protein n=1 Tax=Rhodanobacter sp. Root561 TaxID=1736560 RepID=UPI0006FA3ABD|nr:sulfotransferase [Rhodanobacter sp. Root561]KQZ74413.1 sulfotransferase [Rhodanobacter sp. Root561]